MKKIVLTSITQPSHLTRDEANILSCMSLMSYALDPLSKKMI